jgi:hypothetical protein
LKHSTQKDRKEVQRRNNFKGLEYFSGCKFYLTFSILKKREEKNDISEDNWEMSLEFFHAAKGTLNEFQDNGKI